MNSQIQVPRIALKHQELSISPIQNQKGNESIAGSAGGGHLLQALLLLCLSVVTLGFVKN